MKFFNKKFIYILSTYLYFIKKKIFKLTNNLLFFKKKKTYFCLFNFILKIK